MRKRKITSCHTSMRALWSDGKRCTYNSHNATNVKYISIRYIHYTYVYKYNDLILNRRLDLSHLWYALFDNQAKTRCQLRSTCETSPPCCSYTGNVILLGWVSVPSATAALRHVLVDSCVIRGGPLSQHLWCLGHKWPHKDDCFVSEYLSIFSFSPNGRRHHWWWGVFLNNVCPIWCLFTRQHEAAEGGEGESHSWNSPEPKCKQQQEVSTKGKGHVLSVWLISPPPRWDVVSRYGRLAFETWWQITPNLRYICPFILSAYSSPICLLWWYFIGSLFSFFFDSNCSTWSFVVLFTNSAYWFPVSTVLCRIQLYKALHTSTLHSPFKIVSLFNHSIHIEQGEVMTPLSLDGGTLWNTRTVNWVWKTMEDSFKPSGNVACTGSIQGLEDTVIVIVTRSSPGWWWDIQGPFSFFFFPPGWTLSLCIFISTFNHSVRILSTAPHKFTSGRCSLSQKGWLFLTILKREMKIKYCLFFFHRLY